MPSFSFSGFPIGASVALSILQDGSTVSNAVSSWGQGSMGSVAIQSTAPTRVTAPSVIWFEATDHADLAAFEESGAEYDGPAQEYTHIWTVRGEPFAPFSAPENMVPEWQNRNIAYGRKVAMSFPTTGSFTIDLWVIDRLGKTAVAETTITVQDGDAVYPNAQTICFSNDAGETWSDEKSGCQRSTSIADLVSRIGAASLPTRVLLKRNQTIEDLSFGLFANDGLELIDAWGAGEKPIWTPPANERAITFDGDFGVDQFTLANIKFQGGWDSTTETGVANLPPLRSQLKLSDTYLTFHSVTFDGFQQAGSFCRGGAILYADCVMTNWQNYGAFFNPFPRDVSLAFIGCRVAQHVDALNGGDNAKVGLGNDHGPLRTSETATTYIAQCDMFSRNGWSTLTPDNADQPCFRLNTHSPPGAYVMLDRVTCEGGFKVAACEPHSNNVPQDPGTYIFDKVLLIGTSRQPGAFLTSQYGGTQVRNVYGFQPNVASYHTTNSKNAVLDFFTQGSVPTLENPSGPMVVHSNTFFSLQTASNDSGDTWDISLEAASFDTRISENNVLVAEDIDTPVSGLGPLETSALPGITPRYKGVRFNFDYESYAAVSDLPDGGSFTMLYPSGTNQAYWQGLSDTNHTLKRGGLYYTADNGDLVVSFDATTLTVTNTSGETWNSGTWYLRLDRASQIPAMDTTYASPATIPLPRPDVGSGALNTGDGGRRPYDDFFGHVRPGLGGVDHLGNQRPETGNEQGAFLAV